jgi:dienelactone hydrolase
MCFFLFIFVTLHEISKLLKKHFFGHKKLNTNLMKKILIAFLLFSHCINAQLKPIVYTDALQKLNGLGILSEKKSKSKPGILILPAWKGIDDHAKDSAERLAKLGYTVFVADIYGEGNYPTNTQQAGQQAGYYKKNIEAYHKRIQLALAELIKLGANSENIVVMGYCFGGTGAIEAARTNMNIKGAVSFHGGLSKNAAQTVVAITPKVLVLHGADDLYVPATEVAAFQQEMKDAKADWQMNYYANAVHSFTDKNAGTDNSKGAAYNEKAEKRSWEAMLTFLNETLLK